MTTPKPIATTASGQVQKKLIANQKMSELTKLKQLWRDQLTDAEKEEWRNAFSGPKLNIPAIRELILDKLEILLTSDRQLYEFRKWELQDRQYELQAECVEHEKRRMREEHPDWDKDRIREELLKETYAHSMYTGAYPLGLQAARADAQIAAVDLNREKFKESLRAKINAGIDMLAEEAKGNPVVQAAVNQLRAALVPE